MSDKKFTTFEATEGSGEVSAIYDYSEDSIAILVLSHGAGAGMQHAFMEELSNRLVKEKIAVFRFNFPFMEGTRGRPDPPARAMKTIHNAIAKAHSMNKDLPLFAGGKSFGGRMTSKLAADWEEELLKGLVYFGFPLHAPGKPGIERAIHFKDISQPMLFLQGTRDSLATPELITEVTAPLSNSKVIFYEGADHSFKVPKKLNISPEEMMERLVKDTVEWMKGGSL